MAPFVNVRITTALPGADIDDVARPNGRVLRRFVVGTGFHGFVSYFRPVPRIRWRGTNSVHWVLVFTGISANTSA
jgi:hypothetical protein